MRGHFMRLIWVQTALRLRARASGVRVLLNTVPEAILGSSVPQVTVVHDLLPLFFPAEYPRQQYYFRSLVPRVLRRSRVVVADSESTRRDITKSYGVAPEKIRVVYPGYDPTTYGPGDGDRRLRCRGGLLSALRRQSSPPQEPVELLDALAILRRRIRARLIIRGDGQPAYARAVRERVETLGLREVVTFRRYSEGASCGISTRTRRASCCRPCTRVSGCPFSRPWPAGRRSSRRAARHFPRSGRRRAQGRSARHRRPVRRDVSRARGQRSARGSSRARTEVGARVRLAPDRRADVAPARRGSASLTRRPRRGGGRSTSVVRLRRVRRCSAHWITQLEGADPGAPLPLMLVPFRSQMTTAPECRHRTSALPFPLKLPTPDVQSAGRGGAVVAGAVHQPDADGARGVPPEDVGLAVPVEVAHARDGPLGALPHAGLAVRP